MEKHDLRKQFKHLYLPSSKKVEVVNVPEFRFAMVDGVIEPGSTPGTSSVFRQAIEALYGISYTLKFASKRQKEAPTDYTVMPLEALWWMEDGEFDITKPDNWHWTAMIMQPAHITESVFQEALAELRAKRPNPALDRLRLETFTEGLCMQTMHIGPYSTEPETISKMTAFAAENGYALCGKHHEIYLGDPRRSAPEKLKTVIRLPIQRGG